MKTPNYREIIRQGEIEAELRRPPEDRWKEAGVPPRFMDATLESFECDVEKLDDPQTRAWLWATDFDPNDTKSALLCGRTGTGKTHLAISILKEWLDPDCTGRYATVKGAISEIKDTWGRESTIREEDAMRGFTTPRLLVLDEVEVEFGSDTERVILFEMLGTRYDQMLPTILISNLPRAEVSQFLGDRVVDRMREGGGRLVTFDWDSHRRDAK